jgi:uncharacterized protein with PQ loop repeat
MKKNYKKILLVFVTACFILTATNVMLAIHLAGHDKGKNHDSENCPICQHAIVSKNPVILSNPVTVCTEFVILFAVIYNVSLLPQISRFQLPQLRAPPFVF